MMNFVEDLDRSEKRVVIIDCRSYRASMANRLKGGGVECVGQYLKASLSAIRYHKS